MTGSKDILAVAIWRAGGYPCVMGVWCGVVVFVAPFVPTLYPFVESLLALAPARRVDVYYWVWAARLVPQCGLGMWGPVVRGMNFVVVRVLVRYGSAAAGRVWVLVRSNRFACRLSEAELLVVVVYEGLRLRDGSCGVRARSRQSVLRGIVHGLS